MSGPTTWCYLDKAPAMQHKRGCATDGLLSSALFLAPPVLPSVVMAIMVPAGQGLGSGSYYRTRAADAQSHTGTRGCRGLTSWSSVTLVLAGGEQRA